MPDFQIERSWAGRGFAAVRCILFVVLYLVLAICIGRILRTPFSHVHGDVSRGIFRSVFYLVMVLLSTAAMARFEGRKVWEFGLGGRNKVRAALLGTFCGAAMVTLVLVTLAVFGAFSFGARVEFGLRAIQFAALYVLSFTALAVLEETAFRGYALVNLSRAVGFWPALLILSALFGMAHISNERENRIGLAGAAIWGVLLGYSFRWSGSLWLAIGLHASWDYCQSFIFGVADSGSVVPGRLMNPVTTGPAWLTGGTVGPEASPLMVGVYVILFLIVRFVLKAEKMTSTSSTVDNSGAV